MRPNMTLRIASCLFVSFFLTRNACHSTSRTFFGLETINMTIAFVMQNRSGLRHDKNRFDHQKYTISIARVAQVDALIDVACVTCVYI